MSVADLNKRQRVLVVLAGLLVVLAFVFGHWNLIGAAVFMLVAAAVWS